MAKAGNFRVVMVMDAVVRSDGCWALALPNKAGGGLFLLSFWFMVVWDSESYDVSSSPDTIGEALSVLLLLLRNSDGSVDDSQNDDDADDTLPAVVADASAEERVGETLRIEHDGWGT